MAASEAFDWTPERIEKAVSLFKQGLTATEIANRLNGPSRSAVLGKLHRLGHKRDLSPRQAQKLSIAARERPQEPRWTPERERRAIELFTEGATYNEIAETLGYTTKNAVQKYLNARGYRHDLPPSKRGRMGRITGQGGKLTEDGTREPPRILASSEADLPLPQSRRIKLLDMPMFGACRWPIGDPRDEDFCFCGADTGSPKMSYCPSHRALSTRVPSPSEAKAGKVVA